MFQYQGQCDLQWGLELGLRSLIRGVAPSAAWRERTSGWLRTLQMSKRCMSERSALPSLSAMASTIQSAGGRRDAEAGGGRRTASLCDRGPRCHVRSAE